jgi:hypothetical protein
MTALYQTYGPAGTITLTSPASAGNSSAARASAAIDNSITAYPDYLIRHTFLSGTVTGNKQVICYVSGSDDGVRFESVATGSDAAVVVRSPESMPIAKIIPTPTSNVTYTAVYSVAKCWDGPMPKKFCIVMVDDGGSTGTAISFGSITSQATPIYYTNT